MIAAVLAAVILAAPAAPSAAGSVGNGIQANDVCFAQPLHPGSTVHAKVYIQNTGTDPGFIAVTIGPPPRPSQLGPLHPPLSSYTLHARPVPPSWVTIESGYLAAGQGRTVPVTVTVPGDADGQYEATINANPAGAASAGQGASVSLGGGAATHLKFAVNAAPPDCDPPKIWTPWWSQPRPRNVVVARTGWSFSTAFGGIWTYNPVRGGPYPDASQMPPGWSPTGQMQVLLGCCGDFVLRHKAGWRYLPNAGPLGVITFEPPGGDLPAWALEMTRGKHGVIPDPGWPGGIPTAGTGTIPAASPAAVWGDPQTPPGPDSKPSLTGLLAIAAIVSVGGWGLNRIRRRRGGSR